MGSLLRFLLAAPQTVRPENYRFTCICGYICLLKTYKMTNHSFKYLLIVRAFDGKRRMDAFMCSLVKEPEKESQRFSKYLFDTKLVRNE
jgi:hypothetical protein